MFAFTNANRVRASGTLSNSIEVMNDRRIDALYQAVIEATEESVVNALFKAHTVVGRDGNTLHAIPIQQTLELLQKYGRI
jgi:D-aminopeptidase